MKNRIRGTKLRFWLSMWHEIIGHPAADVMVTHDNRPSGHLWGECQSCGCTLELEGPTVKLKPYSAAEELAALDEADTDEYRLGDRSDA